MAHFEKLKPKEDKWAETLLVPRRKRGEIKLAVPLAEKVKQNAVTKEMAKSWNAKLKESKVSRTSTGRLHLTIAAETEEERSKKARARAEKKKAAEEQWKAWKKEKEEQLKKRAVAEAAAKGNKRELTKEEEELKRQAAVNAFNEWQREKIKKNRELVKEMEMKAKMLQSIESEKSKLLEERAVLLQNKERARQGYNLMQLGAGGIDAPNSVTSVANSVASYATDSSLKYHRRRKVTKKLKKLMETPYTQQMIKNSEAHYKVWGKKNQADKQNVPSWLIPKNVAHNLGWKEEIENPGRKLPSSEKKQRSSQHSSPNISPSGKSARPNDSPPVEHHDESDSERNSPDSELRESAVVLSPNPASLQTVEESGHSASKKRRRRGKKNKNAKTRHLKQRPPWNGNAYEMRPRGELGDEGDDGTYVGGKAKKKATTSIERIIKWLNEKPPSTFKDAQITALLTECLRVDREKRGTVSRSQFASALKKVGFNGSNDEHKQLFEELDYTKSGFVQYDELAILEKERKEQERLVKSKKKAKMAAVEKEASRESAVIKKKETVPEIAKSFESSFKNPAVSDMIMKATTAAVQEVPKDTVPSAPVDKEPEEAEPPSWVHRAKHRQIAEQTRRMRAMIKTPSSSLGVEGKTLAVKSATFDKLDEKAIAALCTPAGPKPPPLIMRILGAVCMLLGENPTWLVAQRLVNEPDVRARLRKFNATSVTEETLHRLQRVTHHPKFSPETLVEDEQYHAFAPLCDWVLEAVIAADEHYREKWAAIGLTAPQDSFGEGDKEIDEATTAALREQREADAAVMKAEKDQALACKERAEADRAKIVAQEKARFAGIARREAEVALQEAVAEEEEAAQAKKEMDARGDTSEYAMKILEKEQAEAKAARERAQQSLEAAEIAEAEAAQAIKIFEKEEEEARAMEKLADEEAHVAKLELKEAEIAKRRAQMKVQEAKERAEEEAQALQRLEEEKRKADEKARIEAEKILQEQKHKKDEEERRLIETERALAEALQKEEEKLAMLAERDEEIAIEKKLAAEQAIKALADSEKVEAQLKDMEIKQKSTRQLTRREMMLEKRREKALEREAANVTVMPPETREKDEAENILADLETIIGNNNTDTSRTEEEDLGNDEEFERSKEQAAIKLQKLQRGRVGRETHRRKTNEKNAVIKIQSAARRKSERLDATKRVKERKKHFSNVYSGVRDMEAVLDYLFTSIDANNNGQISKTEIMKALSRSEMADTIKLCPPLKPLLHPKTYRETFNAMDTNHDNSVDFQELRMFCAGMYSMDASNDIEVKTDLAASTLKAENSDGGETDVNSELLLHDNLKRILRSLFKAMGHEDSQRISKVDFMHGLHKDDIREIIQKCPPLTPLLKPRAFWATLMSIDTDNDGHVSFDEIRGFCSGVVAAQRSVVLTLKEAKSLIQEVTSSLNSFYKMTELPVDAPVSLKRILKALDEPYAYQSISAQTPLLQLREMDSATFGYLKGVLLNRKMVVEAESNIHSANSSEMDDLDVEISFHEMIVYSIGLCVGWGHARLNTPVGTFGATSGDYTLNQALKTLFTLMRVPKLHASKYASTKKTSIVHYVNDPIVREKLGPCIQARVLLDPEWYWAALTALPTAAISADEVTQDDLRVFICGLNDKYMPKAYHRDSNQSNLSALKYREYMDRIGGSEKVANTTVNKFIWVNSGDRYIGKYPAGDELDFYEHNAATNISIRRIIPRFGGVAYHNGLQFIKLENVARGFNCPCIMDIKIGADLDGNKISSEAFNIVGMRLWNADFEQFTDTDSEMSTFEGFLTLGTSKTSVRLDLLRTVIKTLKERLKSFESTQNTMDFFGSSLLLAYDAETKDASVRCVLIDFEKTVLLRGNTAHKHQDHCIEGVQNVIKKFEACATKLLENSLNGLFALNDALQIKKMSGTDEPPQSNLWPGVRECLHLDIPELILRSVRIAVILLDKHGKGFLVFDDIEEAATSEVLKTAISLLPRCLCDMLNPEKILEILSMFDPEEQKKGRRFKLHSHVLYRYCLKKEALSRAETIEHGDGVPVNDSPWEDHSKRVEWVRGLLEIHPAHHHTMESLAWEENDDGEEREDCEDSIWNTKGSPKFSQHASLAQLTLDNQ